MCHCEVRLTLSQRGNLAEAPLQIKLVLVKYCINSEYFDNF